MFGVGRIIGGPWTNPHAAEFFNRLRLILITAGRGYTLDKCPVQADDPNEIMLTAQPGAVQALGNNVAGRSQNVAGSSQNDVAAPSATAPEVDNVEVESDSSIDDAEEVIASDDDNDESDALTVPVDFGEHMDQESYDGLFGDEVNNPSADEESDSEDEESEPRAPGELLLPAITPDECSENALITVAGWLAHEVRVEHPQFADQTRTLPTTDLPPWLARLSRGGLSYPRDEFLGAFRLMKADFDNYHGGPKSVSHDDDIKKNFLKILKTKYPQMPKVVLTKFTNFHTHLRIRYLNILRRQAAGERREEARARRKALQYVS